MGIATLGGMYTHFFFIIFACPVVLLNLLYLYKEKSGKGLLKYILTGAIGGISAILLFPTYIQKISGNDGNSNSAQTHANMRNFSDWSNRLKGCIGAECEFRIVWKRVGSYNRYMCYYYYQLYIFKNDF